METFADLINEAMARKRTPEGRPWSDYTLSAAIGLLPGDRSFNAKQVWRLRRGERQTLTRELVERLVSILDLPEDQAWHAAGLWPPDLDLESYRRYRQFAATPANGVSARYVATLPVAPELEDAELLRRLGVPQLHERRQRDRRHLHLVRPVAA